MLDQEFEQFLFSFSHSDGVLEAKYTQTPFSPNQESQRLKSTIPISRKSEISCTAMTLAYGGRLHKP